MNKHIRNIAIGILALALQPAYAALADTGAATGVANIAGSTLHFGTGTSTVTFSAITLDGLTDQSARAAPTQNVTDATGSGNGWNVSVAATQFSTGGIAPHTLSTTALSIGTASSAASAGTNATNGVTGYPLTVPSTGVKVFSATASTGMGTDSITLPYSLFVPVATFAGAYSSTLTYTLTSAP